MDKKEAVRAIAKIRIALDAVTARTESECMHKCICYKGLEKLEELLTAEEVTENGDD